MFKLPICNHLVTKLNVLLDELSFEYNVFITVDPILLFCTIDWLFWTSLDNEI